jgi:acetyltransferase-like isoleucine patch superfamily enzyme
MYDLHGMIESQKKSNLEMYLDRFVGSSSLIDLIKYELAVSFGSKIPGGIGISLRKYLYRKVLKNIGRGTLIGYGVSIRNPKSISVGKGTLVDDFCLFNAKTTSMKGLKIGNNCVIGLRTFITTGYNGYVVINDNVHVNGPDTHIVGSGGVSVGENVMIGARVSIVSTNHVFKRRDILIKDQGTTAKGIVIEDDVWLGTGVVVLDGITIHKGAVVGAGAIVTKDIPEYAVAVGVPSKVIKFRE